MFNIWLKGRSHVWVRETSWEGSLRAEILFFFLVPKWAPKSMCGITNIPQTSCTYEVRSAKIIMIDTMDWMGAPCITLYSNELFNCHVSMPLLPMWQRVPWILVSFGHSSTQGPFDVLERSVNALSYKPIYVLSNFTVCLFLCFIY